MPTAWRRYFAVPRTSSIGLHAPEASSPNCLAIDGVMTLPDSQKPPSSSAAFRNSSAALARIGVGAAEPMPVRTVRVSGCSARPKAHTAMTIALRVPTLEYCCGPVAFLMWTVLISSSAASALRLTPV